jgi:hypothetical protein
MHTLSNATSKSNSKKGPARRLKQELRNKQRMESRGVTFEFATAKEAREAALARSGTGSTDAFLEAKTTRDSGKKVDILGLYYHELWSMPPAEMSTTQVTPAQVEATTARYRQGDTCLLCGVTGWSHFGCAKHVTNARQMHCFDALLGSCSGVRNFGPELKGFPLNQQTFKAYWGDNIERLVEVFKLRIAKDGIAVKRSKTGKEQVCGPSQIKSTMLWVATYNCQESKYNRHFGMPFCSLPETAEHDVDTMQALPPNASWWPVVRFEFEDESMEWNEEMDMEAGTIISPGTQIGAGYKMVVTWVWVGCVWQAWWLPRPAAWPVRVFRRLIRPFQLQM